MELTKLTLADGKERALYFSNVELKIIKAKYGVSVFTNGPMELFKPITEDKLSELLVLGFDHGLEGGQPGIATADVDKLLDVGNAHAACSAIIKALTAWRAPEASPAPAASPAASPVPTIPDPTTVN